MHRHAAVLALVARRAHLRRARQKERLVVRLPAAAEHGVEVGDELGVRLTPKREGEAGRKCAETGATHQEVAEGLAERLGPLEHAVELVVSPPLRRVVADPTLVPVGVERVVERRDFVLAQEVLHHLCSTLRLRGERSLEY